jgi:hypothetical protein
MEHNQSTDDKKRQEFNRQKELVKEKINKLKKELKQLEIEYRKKELDDKIKDISEGYRNLLPLEEFKKIHRNSF